MVTVDKLPENTEVTPGSILTLRGKGFVRGTVVLIKVGRKWEKISNAKVQNSTRLQFVLKRPRSSLKNKFGQSVTKFPREERYLLRAQLPNGILSNVIRFKFKDIHMLVIGDSIQWGQGLLDEQKIHSLTAQNIRQKFSSSYDVVNVYKYVYAHSGATIGYNDNHEQPAEHGEVPTDYPTIMQQLDLFKEKDKWDKIDYVLLDGGINDVDVFGRIVNPDSSVSDLTEKTKLYCHDHMLELLRIVASRFKNARIIVTGYFYIVSDSSIYSKKAFLFVAYLLAALHVLSGLPAYSSSIPLSILVAIVLVAIIQDKIRRVINRCEIFAEDSTRHLNQAVSEANAELGEGVKRIFFAESKFRKRNAVFANNSWLFELKPNGAPEDAARSSRSAGCTAAGLSGMDHEMCRRASAGHPTARGAGKYAESIKGFL